MASLEAVLGYEVRPRDQIGGSYAIRIVVIAALLGILPNWALAWQTEVDGTTADVYDSTQPNDIARSVVLDASGDLIAAGRLNNFDTGFDFTVAKYSGATGAEMWRKNLNGTDGAFERARSVAVDAAGDVIAAGRLRNTATHYDFAVAKFSGVTGQELWRNEINGTDGTFEWAWAVTVDASGNAIAVGRIRNLLTDYDFSVIKFDGATGAVLWHQDVNGTDGTFDWAHGVVVDPAGDVVAVGRLNNVVTGYDFTVIKFSGATGTELWRQEINGTDGAFDEAQAVAVDASGDVVATGRVNNIGTGYDFMVVKLSGATGTEIWRREMNGTEGSFDRGNSVEIDHSGDVFVDGRLNNLASGYDFTVAKLSGTTGLELWRQEIDGTTDGGIDEAVSVKLDGSGNVISGGVLVNALTGDDMAVIKHAGSTGLELWRREINGTDGASDELLSIAVDVAGYAFAGGRLLNSGTADDWVVLKVPNSSDFPPTVVPDGAAGSEMLAVSRPDTSSLTISWGPDCNTPFLANEYTLYIGNLDSLSDFGVWDYSADAPICNAGIDRTETIPTPDGNKYFLTAPHNEVVEGSYGQNSSGVERPAAGPEACHNQDLTGACL